MTRPVMTIQLFRPNVHIRPPSVVADVWWVVKVSTMGFLWVLVAILVMA